MYGSQEITPAQLAAARIVPAESVKPNLAAVTSLSFDVLFAHTLAIHWITQTTVHRPIKITVTRYTGIRVVHRALRVLVVKRPTELTLRSNAVVPAVITHTTANPTSGQIAR